MQGRRNYFARDASGGDPSRAMRRPLGVPSLKFIPTILSLARARDSADLRSSVDPAAAWAIRTLAPSSPSFITFEPGESVMVVIASPAVPGWRLSNSLLDRGYGKPGQTVQGDAEQPI
jgi:hypothetical protein